jgi:hypothetical protein
MNYYHPLCAPGLDVSMEDSLEMHREEILKLLESFLSVTVMLYDIVEEPSRTDTSMTLHPKPRYESLSYLKHLQIKMQRVKGIQWCLFRAIRKEDTLESLHKWYLSHHSFFDALVLTGNHWNPLKLDEVYLSWKSTTGVPLKKLGAVLIPHRFGEMERVRKRREAGVDFFVTQLQLYPTEEWKYFVNLLGNFLITLTTVPSSQKQLEFLATLGVQTHDYAGVEASLSVKMQQCWDMVHGIPFGIEILPESRKSRRTILHVFTSIHTAT